MIRFLFVINTLILFSVVMYAQETNPLSDRIYNQLEAFPQEKIYVHTDKSLYVAGEKIWYRAYLVSALLHTPANASRYVYIELTAPSGEVISRDKIRPDSVGAFHNSLELK